MKKGNTSSRSSSKSGAGKKSSGKQSSSTGRGGSSGRNGTQSRNGSARKSAIASSSRGASAKRRSGSSQEDLEKIFEDLLKDTYWAEKHLVKSLPRMSKAASTEELKEAFDNHLAETEEQVTRLEQVFETCGFRVAGKKCEAMEGLVEEAKEIISEHEEGVVRDVALIIAAQKVEHYEIAAYGSLRTLADVMGKTECAQLLEETLDEESNADETLTDIAMRVNQEAYSESEEEEGEESEEDEEEEEEETDDVEMSDEEDEETEDEGDDEGDMEETENEEELTTRRS